MSDRSNTAQAEALFGEMWRDRQKIKSDEAARKPTQPSRRSMIALADNAEKRVAHSMTSLQDRDHSS